MSAMCNGGYNWQGAGTKLPSGHTIFETSAVDVGRASFLRCTTGSVGIADHSGARPDLTEDARMGDGPLFLDFNRSLDVGDALTCPTVPLINEKGETYSTPVDAPTIFFLSREFGWSVQDETSGGTTMSAKLRAVYYPLWQPKLMGYLQEIGTFYIGIEDPEDGSLRHEVAIRVRIPAPHANLCRPDDGYHVSIDMHYDGVEVMRKLDERGFLSRFASIKASTFYDVLQCLNVAGIGLMSHDHDSLEYTSRAMYELLNEPQEATA